jgi:hypothetical protein
LYFSSFYYFVYYHIRMAKLSIKRSSEFLNRTRNIAIYIDGQKVGVMSNGDIRDFEVAEGTHTLKAKIDWCGSRDYNFTVVGNETKELRLSGFKYANYVMPVFMVLLAARFMLRRTDGIDAVNYMLIIFALLPVYYMTLGTNDYLRLTDADLIK